MVKKYIPREKDIVSIDLSPSKGHEQNGSRPALVISSKVFNSFTHMALVCPISSNTKEFPTHYLLTETNSVKGSVLCEHIRSIDYDSRHIRKIDTCSTEDYQNVYELVKSFFENE